MKQQLSNYIVRQKAQIKWMTKRHNIIIIFLVFMALIKYCECGIARCPIGFQLLESDYRSLCYKLKEPETYGEKYINCHGNKDNFSLWKDMPGNHKYDLKIWSDFLRLNEDGILISWSLGDKLMGKPLSIYSIDVDDDYDYGKLMCTIFDFTIKELKSVDCNEKYPRFCVVDVYQDPDIDDACPSDEYLKFNSPYSTCLQMPSSSNVSLRRVPLRVTWKQAVEICNKSEGYLLEKGYVYTNHPSFEIEQTMQWELPLGIERKGKTSFFWSNYSNGHGSEKIQQTDWNFAENVSLDNDEKYVALQGNKWILVKELNIFYYVICEVMVHLPRPNIVISQRRNELLGVDVNNTKINEDQLWCFTDSNTYYPTRVHLSKVDKSNSFTMNPDRDGYYWCVSVNTTTHSPQESNKHLFVKDKSTLNRLYAIMLLMDDEYDEDELLGLEKSIEARLNEFVYYRRMMENNFGTVRQNITQTIKKQVQKRLRIDEDLLYGLKIKRVYANEQQLLAHVFLGANVAVLPEGEWKGMRILYMRRAYYCEKNNSLPQSALGGYYNIPHSCVSYKCSGDYNVGAYWELYNNSEECSIVNTTTTDQNVYTKETTTPAKELSSESETDEISTEIEEIPDAIIIPTPKQLLQETVNNLQIMANNTQLHMSNLTKAASQINSVLDLVDVNIPGDILKHFETIVRRVALDDGDTETMIIEENLAVVVVENSEKRYVGMKLDKSSGTDKLTNSSIELITEDDVWNGSINDEITEMYVKMPSISNNSNDRVNFVLYRNDRAFTTNSSTTNKVNSRILCITISNGTDNIETFPENNYVYIHLRPFERNLLLNEVRICAFWDFQLGEQGGWSTEGCELIQSNNSSLDVCRCNHLTHFAEIISTFELEVSESHDTVLTILSFIGCILSLIGLVIIGLTGLLFNSWRREYTNKIWLHLSASMSMMMVSFLMIASVEMNGISIAACIVHGVFLHYSLLASFMWMLVSAIVSYQKLVTVFVKNTCHRLLKASIFAWGTPLVIVTTLLIVDYHNYVDHLTNTTINYTTRFCYPSGLGYWLTLLLPIFTTLLVNAILFVRIIYSVFINTKVKRHGDNQELFRSVTVSFLLFFLFGLTWIFGMLSNIILFNYLFTITGTLQGFVLFIFFVIGNKKSRELWLEFLKIREKKKIPVTSTSSRISAYRRESGNGKITNGTKGKFEDSISTKPRSLSGVTDNSRFF